MRKFLEVLEKYIENRVGDNEIYRIKATKKEFIRDFSKSVKISQKKLNEGMEKYRDILSGNYFIEIGIGNNTQNWSIKYSDRLKQFICERILKMGEVERIIEMSEKIIDNLIAKRIKKLDPEDFEIFCYNVFDEIDGFKVHMTPRGPDGGIDLAGTIDMTTQVVFASDIFSKKEEKKEQPFIAQIKQYTGKVDSATMQSFLGVLSQDRYKDNIGLFIATGGFSSIAKKIANEETKRDIYLIDLDGIINILKKYQIGIERKQVESCYEMNEDIEQEIWPETIE